MYLGKSFLWRLQFSFIRWYTARWKTGAMIKFFHIVNSTKVYLCEIFWALVTTCRGSLTLRAFLAWKGGWINCIYWTFLVNKKRQIRFDISVAKGLKNCDDFIVWRKDWERLIKKEKYWSWWNHLTKYPMKFVGLQVWTSFWSSNLKIV